MTLFQSPTLMTETKLKSAHVHSWDDQWRDLNSWRINHMLGDILISFQLLVTYLVTTLLSAEITTFLEYTWCEGTSNKMGMLSPFCLFWLSVGSNRTKKTCSLCFLEPLTSTVYLPWPLWWSPTENVTIKWLSKSWLHTMSPSML